MPRHVAALGLLLLLAGCTEQVVIEDVGDGGNRDTAGIKDTVANGNEPLCGVSYVPLNYFPSAAQLLIVLDRSSQMQGSFGNTTRELAVESALLGAINTFQSKVKFGFEQFPAASNDKSYGDCQHGGCCAGSVAVDPQYNALPSISGPLQCSDWSPCPSSAYESASQAALQKVQDYYQGRSPLSTDDHYALLITASEPACSSSASGSDPCDNAISAANGLGDLGVRVVVLSVGYQPSADSCLRRISQTGSSLRPPTGMDTLYAPTSVNALNSVVTDFVSQVAQTGCTQSSYDTPPPDGAQVTLSVGTTPVAQVDSTSQNGWSFANSARTSITLSGTACDNYVNSQSNKISAVYSCSTCGGPYACPYSW